MDSREMESEFPEEFDSKAFIGLIEKRFGRSPMSETELLRRLDLFLAPRYRHGTAAPTEAEVAGWYEQLLSELQSTALPLDGAGSDLSRPMANAPSLQKRLEEQGREVSIAAEMLAERKTSKVKDRRPDPPVMK
jgi:exonuclease VII small subunit